LGTLIDACFERSIRSIGVAYHNLSGRSWGG